MNSSTTWETTTDDFDVIFSRHGIKPTADAIVNFTMSAAFDEDAIIKGLLHYVTIEDQTASALSDLEDQLMNAGLLPKGPKKFLNPS